MGDFMNDGTQYVLRFAEKGGKARSIPVRHDLERLLQEYLMAAGLEDGAKDAPLFARWPALSRKLSDRPMNGVDVCRMVKRRLSAAELANNYLAAFVSELHRH